MGSSTVVTSDLRYTVIDFDGAVDVLSACLALGRSWCDQLTCEVDCGFAVIRHHFVTVRCNGRLVGRACGRCLVARSEARSLVGQTVLCAVVASDLRCAFPGCGGVLVASDFCLAPEHDLKGV